MLLKSLSMAFVATALAVVPAGAGPTEPLHEQVKAGIDRLAAQTVATWPLPGVAIAIVNRDQTLHVAGFGSTGDARNSRVDPDTLFLINSMTKAMSAAVVGAMVDEGRLDWSDPVRRHLPWFELRDPIASAHVSIEDALVHRTGVECNDWLEDVPGMTWDEGLRRHRFLGLTRPFRTRYEYCNWTFSLAGRIAAEIDGGWSETLGRRLFAPLGMMRSVPVFASAIVPGALSACHECELLQAHRGPELRAGFSNVAMPHVDRDGRLVRSPWRNSAAYAAGSVLSTANDLSLYARMLLNRGRHEGRQILSEQVVSDIVEPRIPTGSEGEYPALNGFGTESARIGGWSVAYGYGWELGRYAARRVIHHGGGSLGFESKIVLLPDEGFGVIVLSNYNHRKWGGVDILTFGILDRLLGLQPGNWQDYVTAIHAKEKAEAASGKVATPKPRESQPAAVPVTVFGAYCHPVYGRASIVPGKQGGLELNQGPERRGYLLALGGDRFSLSWNGPRNEPHLVTIPAGGRELHFGEPEEAVRFVRCADPASRKDTEAMRQRPVESHQ